jgi:hypothetical protein
MNSPRPFLASTVFTGRITAETRARWHRMTPVAAAPKPKNFKVDIFLKNRVCRKN